MNKCYILTMEINEYDQYGEYYLTGWNHNPSDEELEKAIKNNGYTDSPKIDLNIVRTAKDTRLEPYTMQDAWFHLRSS